MSPLPRRMLGSAASWENPQVHPYPLPEGLTYVDTAVAIKLFYGFPTSEFKQPMSWEFSRFPFRVLTDFQEKFAYAYANRYSQAELNVIVEELNPSCNKERRSSLRITKE